MNTNLLAAAIISLALPAASQAAVGIGVDFSSTTAILVSNNFQSLLAGLGLTRYATTGASLFLNGPATMMFEFLGSESGFSDTFATTSGLSHTESSSFTNNFHAPVFIGSQAISGGFLAGLLNFSSSSGAPATVGQNGFAIFLGPNQASGSNVSEIYFGYDDEVVNQDDDYDDFLVRAIVASPVPEPST